MLSRNGIFKMCMGTQTWSKNAWAALKMQYLRGTLHRVQWLNEKPDGAKSEVSHQKLKHTWQSGKIQDNLTWKGPWDPCNCMGFCEKFGHHDKLTTVFPNLGGPCQNKTPHLASPDLLGILALLNITESFHLLEQLHSCTGLLNRLNSIGDDQRDLRDLINAMATGHHQRGKGSGCQCRAHGIASLILVDLVVPATPGFCGGKHATTTAHLALEVKVFFYRINRYRWTRQAVTFIQLVKLTRTSQSKCNLD